MKVQTSQSIPGEENSGNAIPLEPDYIDPEAVGLANYYLGESCFRQIECVPIWKIGCGVVLATSCTDPYVPEHPLVRALPLTDLCYNNLKKQTSFNPFQNKQPDFKLNESAAKFANDRSAYKNGKDSTWRLILKHAFLSEKVQRTLHQILNGGAFEETDLPIELQLGKTFIESKIPLISEKYLRGSITNEDWLELDRGSARIVAEDEKTLWIALSSPPEEDIVSLLYQRWRSRIDRRLIRLLRSPQPILNHQTSGLFRMSPIDGSPEGKEGSPSDGLRISLNAVEGINPRSVATPPEQLRDYLLSQVALSGASDLHLGYQNGSGWIRIRQNGELQTLLRPSIQKIRSLVGQIQNLAGLKNNDYEPRDGQFALKVDQADWNIRVAAMPHRREHPSLVLRFLPRSEPIALGRYGLPPEQLSQWLDAVERPQGLVLVTGPTGSGKTTFLFSTLARLNDEKKSIITIEDPIEYEIEGLTQVALNEYQGIQATTVLRNVVRMDPDIIFCGEIRDRETAHLVVEAAMTGHLVLSTLHSQTAADAIERLITHLGVDPYLLSQALSCVTNSRLMAKICPHCCNEVIRYSENFFQRGTGCSKCSDGIIGRVPIMEMITIHPGIADLIRRRSGANSLAAAAFAKTSSLSLKEQAATLARAGAICVEDLRKLPGEWTTKQREEGIV